MSVFLVDLGNSAVKWTGHGNNMPWQPQAILYRDAGLDTLLEQHWAELPAPERVIYCSVAGAENEAQLQAWVGQHWDVPLQAITAEVESRGVRNGYLQPGQLGADRWVAMLAARQMTTGPCCVVSCGTATTLDLLDSSGQHLGGVIMPGLDLMARSLASGTANLALAGLSSVDPGEGVPGPPLGRSTAEGIALGSLWGQAGAIRLLLAQYRSLVTGELTVFLSGGAADQLQPLLDESTLQVVPDLVLKGLAQVADT